MPVFLLAVLITGIVSPSHLLRARVTTRQH
jgi:hypothetical protein